MRGVEVDPQLGGAYAMKSWTIQDDEGALIESPVQLTRLASMADIFNVEAEEVLGEPVTVGGGGEHIINIDSNINNINLRTLHDTLFTAPTASTVVTCYISPGVIVGSTSTGAPALDIGTWPVGATVNLNVQGRIQGHGGKGGDATGAGVENGFAGGLALLVARAINLTDTTGQIWGGGGGGGGALGAYGFGGGGGAGQLPGTAGAGTTTNQFDGTTEAGGASFTDGATATSGAGGGPGLAGGNGAGSFSGNHPGGATGLAINGIAFVTTVGGAGDRRGGTA
jgi:hypothetical protein